MDMKTESCKHLESKHLENQTVACKLTHGFRRNAFMKNGNENLGACDLY
jgi:hypothetical protein